MEAMAAMALALQGLPQLTALARLSGLPATAAAARKLDESRIWVKGGLRGEGDLLERGVFGEFGGVVRAARGAKDNKALLVYGPRGVGKTCLVAAALKVRCAARVYLLRDVHAQLVSTTDISAFLSLADR